MKTGNLWKPESLSCFTLNWATLGLRVSNIDLWKISAYQPPQGKPPRHLNDEDMIKHHLMIIVTISHYHYRDHISDMNCSADLFPELLPRHCLSSAWPEFFIASEIAKRGVLQNFKTGRQISRNGFAKWQIVIRKGQNRFLYPPCWHLTNTELWNVWHGSMFVYFGSGTAAEGHSWFSFHHCHLHTGWLF